MPRTNDYMDTIRATLGADFKAFPVMTGGGCEAFYISRPEWHAHGFGVLLTNGDFGIPGWGGDDVDPDLSMVSFGVTGAHWAIRDIRPEIDRWDDPSTCTGATIPADTSRPDGWPDPVMVARAIAHYGDRIAAEVADHEMASIAAIDAANATGDAFPDIRPEV